MSFNTHSTLQKELWIGREKLPSHDKYPDEICDTGMCHNCAIHNHPDQCMSEWIRVCGEISSLFRKVSVLCQATHPSFHEFANLSHSFNDYKRHPNPIICSTMIKCNLG